MRPRVLRADTITCERHGEDLVNEHRPAAPFNLYGLNPAALRKFDQGDGLEQAFRRFTEEGGVRRLTLTPSSATHALQERAHRVRSLGLQHPIEVAHINSKF